MSCIKYLITFMAVITLVVSCHHASMYVSESNTSLPLESKLSEQPDQSDTNLNTEDYDHIIENPFLTTTDQPLSTFSIDVDRASYANVRRYIRMGSLPPKGAVRIEEMINYFDYQYAPPTSGEPFAVHTEMATCPWNTKHSLVKIGLQGRKVPVENLPASNLVFLVDVSGSMEAPDKLPLVKESLKILTDQLRPSDKVAIVVYAGSEGPVLPSTSGAEKNKIRQAIDQMEAGGATAGGAGIMMAYKVAKENFMANGNNRVILATDGDFNVGISSDDELVSMIEAQRESGVFLSVLGFGSGNYKDNKMQQLADKGNGNHNYIDNLREAKKVFIQEFGGTLFTIAKDVKLQVEFNPAVVQAYRLIGYENRMLQNQDFNDDQKDAGELGAGHTVTALYEVVYAGTTDPMIEQVDALKYQVRQASTTANNEMLTLKLRYKEPQGETSTLMTYPVINNQQQWQEASDDFKLAAGVAAFGLLLRQSAYSQNSSWQQVVNLVQEVKSNDDEGYRAELISLVKSAAQMKR